MSEEKQEKNLSRREFLKVAGYTVGGFAIGGIMGVSLGGTKEKEVIKEVAKDVPKETPNFTEAMQFFTRKEDFECLAAATETIFPEDENGPGAIGLGAPYFIDKQLASPRGDNYMDYMRGPYSDGASPLKTKDIFLQGVRKLNEVSQGKYQKPFKELEEEERIAILEQFMNGEIEMKHASSAQFFALLKTFTLEGCYCDPLYGGNKNMEGWKMKEFPGAYMSHLDVVEEKEFVFKEPQSLSDHM